MKFKCNLKSAGSLASTLRSSQTVQGAVMGQWRRYGADQPGLSRDEARQINHDRRRSMMEDARRNDRMHRTAALNTATNEPEYSVGAFSLCLRPFSPLISSLSPPQTHYPHPCTNTTQMAPDMEVMRHTQRCAIYMCSLSALFST